MSDDNNQSTEEKLENGPGDVGSHVPTASSATLDESTKKEIKTDKHCSPVKENVASAKVGLEDAFKKFASKGNGKEQTSADFTKWAKDAGVVGAHCNSNHIDIAFSKAKAKGSKNITFNELEALINEMASKYKEDQKNKIDVSQARNQITEKLSAAHPKTHGTTKISTKGGVDRMTDASKYTGSHKERFDESGKGKGIEGRKEVTKNTGYVGNYKGEGTHSKKEK